MADDLADYPIVVLEADYQEAAGKLGLFDLLMPVGSTGLVFTAAMPGILRTYGIDFTPAVQRAAYLRAATTLIQMGLVRGESFKFLRTALGLTQLEVAAIYGVTDTVVDGWETNSVPIPYTVWSCFSSRVCAADGIPYPAQSAFGTSWRPRLIRVFPEAPAVPQPNGPYTTSSTCPTPPPIPGSECYPPLKPCY